MSSLAVSGSTFQVVVWIEDGSSKLFDCIIDALKYVREHHSQLLERAKRHIETCIDRGKAGDAKVSPWEMKKVCEDGEVFVIVHLGRLTLV